MWQQVSLIRDLTKWMENPRTRHDGALLSAIQSEAPRDGGGDTSDVGREQDALWFWRLRRRRWRQSGSAQVFVIPWQETTKQVAATQSLSAWHFSPWKDSSFLKSDTSRSHESLVINMINSNAEFLQGNCKTTKPWRVGSVTIVLRGRHRQSGWRSSICRRQWRHRWPQSDSSPQISRSLQFTHIELNSERSWSDGWADKTQARLKNKGKPPCRNVFGNQICPFKLTLSGSMREQTPKLMQPRSSLALQRKHKTHFFS